MKIYRLILVFFVLSLILVSLTSCLDIMSDPVKLDGEYDGYYMTLEDGTISVSNYHPTDFFNLPSYQELVQYGDGVGVENEGVVYYLYVMDIDKSADDEAVYYVAEFDGADRSLLFEENHYFTIDAEKDQFVTKMLDMIDVLRAEHLN